MRSSTTETGTTERALEREARGMAERAEADLPACMRFSRAESARVAHGACEVDLAEASSVAAAG